MRLRDYQELINRAIPIIESLSISANPVNGYPGMYQISNIQNFLAITIEIKKSNLFADIINKIDKIANFNNTIENSTMVSQQSKNTLNAIKTDLLTSTKILQQTLKEVLTEEDENVLNIKLPEAYSSINDYIKFFESIKDVCFPFKYANNEVSISNFDVGSEWIGISLTESCAKLFLSLANKSASLFNKILETKKLITEIDKNKVELSGEKLKAIETTIDIINKNTNKTLEDYKTQLIEEAINESKFLISENINENEFKNHLRIAIEKLGGLILQGMEIVPAIKAKPEIKLLSQNANENIEKNKKLIIGCDNLKYLTIINAEISSKNISADTLEISSDEN